jgi:hypothetical protein
VQLWLREPLTRRELEQLDRCLRATGGYRDRKRSKIIRARFDRTLRHRLRLLQPSTEALQLLARMRDYVYINHRNEVALDLHFPEHQLESADLLIRRHLRMLYHRSPVNSYESTFYISRNKKAARNIAVYIRLSKLTKERCVHLCYRLKGRAALIANDLDTLAAWIHLDFRSFFQSRLLFCDLDYGKLGRLLRNSLKGKHRRHGHVLDHTRGVLDFHEHGWVEDTETGELVLCIQRYLDFRRKAFDVYSCLIPLPNDYLLPKQQQNPTRHYTSYIASLPFFSSQKCPWHGHNMHFSASQTIDYANSAIPKPVLGPRPSKSIPIPRLHTWQKSMDRMGPLTDHERDHIAQVAQETAWLLLGGQPHALLQRTR